MALDGHNVRVEASKGPIARPKMAPSKAPTLRLGAKTRFCSLFTLQKDLTVDAHIKGRLLIILFNGS